MSIIQFSFANDNKILETADSLKLYILEKEGYIPKATIVFPKKMFSELCLFETCVIKKDNDPFFSGTIEYISTQGDETHVELKSFSSEGEYDEVYKSDDVIPPEVALLAKFKRENPDLIASIDQEQTDKLGEKKQSSVFKPDVESAEPKNLDDEIIHGSLKVEKSIKDIISNVNLSVSASWIKRIEGSLGLTTKIAKRFPGGKINTLTPVKLIDSWPRFGDKISNHLSSKQTKYAIGLSRLELDKSMTVMTPEINIRDDIPPFSLKKEFFNHKLSLFWSFDQFSSETVTTKVINSNAPKGIEKNININLQNVQDYIDDIEEHSFFTTSVGNKILSEIYNAIGDYIILSMRNVTISCELPFSKNTENLSCSNWISIQGIKAKITKLEYNITPIEKTVSLTAQTFGVSFDHEKALDIPIIPRPKRKEFKARDIIYDINIQNDADTQYRKLISFIHAQKMENKINKSNYKQLIRSFLHEIQTVIKVIAKPLKTTHCEKSSITTNDIVV
ncbi:MAG: hypothetical protein LBE97_00785 [Holosporales bacterium]|jgi:hypothetical protein|nr:hypothetical protein [Holosporales bacterium]